jgi:hypothetical protein
VAEAVSQLPDTGRPEPPRGRHRRFMLAYALLGTLLGAAFVAFAALATRPEPKPAPPKPQFGQFRPTADGVEGANQIAEFVSRRYRLPSGKQIVAVQAGALAVQETRIPAIAIRGVGQDGEEDIDIVPADKTVAFLLCGLGKACSIPEGKPSKARGRLVRREAVELALYSFAYLDDVDSVVAFLPPPKGTPASHLVFFRRDDLDAALDLQFREALVQGHVPLADEITPGEAITIDKLTEPNVFKFAFQQLQDGRPILVLQTLGSTA